MAISQLALLFFVALFAGTINSIAGGGSLFTVPTMIFSGMLPVVANTTSTVALCPGTIASVGAYRHELAQVRLKLTVLLASISLAGGILGAILLLHTSQETFIHLFPYFLLTAIILFTFSSVITKQLRAPNIQGQTDLPRSTIISISIAQFIIAVYGGYYGGGGGIMMLAALGLTGMRNIHCMNALKALLTTAFNITATVIFIAAKTVIWPLAILMIVGSVMGGYGGAYLARKIEQKWVRYFVMVVGFAMTIYFFIRP